MLRWNYIKLYTAKNYPDIYFLSHHLLHIIWSSEQNLHLRYFIYLVSHVLACVTRPSSPRLKVLWAASLCCHCHCCQCCQQPSTTIIAVGHIVVHNIFYSKEFYNFIVSCLCRTLERNTYIKEINISNVRLI